MNVLLWIIGGSLYLLVGVGVVRVADTRFPGDPESPPGAVATAVFLWPIVAFLLALAMVAYFLDDLVRRG